MPHSPTFQLKRGPADPFRGDWYVFEAEFEREADAVEEAARRTLADHTEWGHSWEEYGSEWSVFVVEDGAPRKIWEGYKYISEIQRGGGDPADWAQLGSM